MNWTRCCTPIAISAALVVVVHIACTWWLVQEGRRNYAAKVSETFKACTGAWNPWEKYPWDN